MPCRGASNKYRQHGFVTQKLRTGQLIVTIMWLGGICQSVWGVIFQWGSTLEVSIELPATSRHRRDLTERLLKATLSPNQTNKASFAHHEQNQQMTNWWQFSYFSQKIGIEDLCKLYPKVTFCMSCEAWLSGEKIIRKCSKLSSGPSCSKRR